MAAAELMSISGAGLNESPFAIAQTRRQGRTRDEDEHGRRCGDGRDGADDPCQAEVTEFVLFSL